MCLYDTSDCTLPQELDSKATVCSNVSISHISVVSFL